MKRVLVVHYSQTGQLSAVVHSLTAPLMASPDVQLRFLKLEPQTPYPFPWSFFRFLDVMPESVYLDPAPILPVPIATDESYDLVILAYQVWFLSPAGPTVAFLQSDAARRLLAGKPVVTIIACRNMWLIAQETMKVLLANVGARLVDNVALTDRGGLATFITTPRWLLTGRKGRWLGLPAAGVENHDIVQCVRFGRALVEALAKGDERHGAPMLTGLDAAPVDVRLLPSERVAHRSFRVWGKLLRAAGPPGSWRRKPVLILYVTFLISLILTVVPITMLIKVLLRPLLKTRLAAQKAYYEKPSGSSRERMGMSHD
jgi:hypothetical protein